MGIKKYVLSFVLFFCFILAVFGKEIGKAEQELGNARTLLYESARILESKNNMIVLDEISEYDWLWANDTDLTTPYINKFNNVVKENKSINEKRERLNYLFQQKKNLAIVALVPNALNLINTTMNIKDSLKGIIAIAGTAVSSVTNYLSVSQQNELELIQSQWELDDQQVDIIEKLCEYLRSYISSMCGKYGFTNEQFSSTNTLREFIKILSENEGEENAQERFIKINRNQFRNELSIYPEYWAELAIASYQIGDYEYSLKCIDEYESIYVATKYHDAQRATIFQIKAYCILETEKDSAEKYIKLAEIADEICKVKPLTDWVSEYFCVELYREILEKSKDSFFDIGIKKKEIALKAYELMGEVIERVADEYSNNLKSYLDRSFIKADKDAIDVSISNYIELISNLESENKQKNISGTKKSSNEDLIDDYKEVIETLENNKNEIDVIENMLLPPSLALLTSMTAEYLEYANLVEKTNTTEHRTRMSQISSLLLDYYSQSVLFNNKMYPYAVSVKKYRNFSLKSVGVSAVSGSVTAGALGFAMGGSLIGALTSAVAGAVSGAVTNLITTDSVLSVTIPATCFVFSEDRLNASKSHIYVSTFKEESDSELAMLYETEYYSYMVARTKNPSTLNDVSITFIIYDSDIVKAIDKDTSFNLFINSEEITMGDAVLCYLE